MKALLLLAVLAFTAFGQDKSLPEYGDISDLKGMTKVYVSTETTQVRKYILDELKKEKSLIVVSSADVADFILECAQQERTGSLTMGAASADRYTFEMTAYLIRNHRHRIAWSESKNSVRYPPTLLTRDFINNLKKSLKP
jgi:hypothetical protein